MTTNQSMEDGFSALSRLEWLLLHAKPADFAKIDMEREVPMAVEQVRRVLRVTTESAAMTSGILAATERERCAKIVEDALSAYDAAMEPVYAEESWGWAMNEMREHVNDAWNAQMGRLREIAPQIRSGR